MSEVRTTSSTGAEKGVKPERYDLLPKAGLDAMARVYTFGAEKYADHNWRRKYEWSKSISAALRHMMAFQDGETNDPESGLPHPAHAMFHMAALLTWLAEDGEGAGNPMDDRWPASMERAAREALEEVVVYVNPLTDTTSDIPSGLGDLSVVSGDTFRTLLDAADQEEYELYESPQANESDLAADAVEAEGLARRAPKIDTKPLQEWNLPDMRPMMDKINQSIKDLVTIQEASWQYETDRMANYIHRHWNRMPSAVDSVDGDL